MSEKKRNLLAVALLLLLAGSAFTAGYFTNAFVESRATGTLFGHADREFGLFWEAWSRIEDSFIGDLPNDTQLTYNAIRGAVGGLNDPYTVFVEPVAREQERQSLQGTFGGIGAFLRRPEDGGPIILEPIPGNPAELAGILVNDVLIAVDGVEITAEMSVSEVADLIKGRKGSIVTLTVMHPDETRPTVIEIVRDDILIPSVSYRLSSEDARIGLIQLSRFSGESPNELRSAVEDLQAQGAEQLILDLRQNGGGLLDTAIAIADFFLTDGPILYQQSKEEGEHVFEASQETLLPEMPLVILIDGGSASASEILAGALQDRGRATLIGTTSFGKGSVQLVYDLSDGSSVHVTSARWYTPDRQQIDQHGVQPDIEVVTSQEAIDNGRDEILSRAVAFLQNGS